MTLRRLIIVSVALMLAGCATASRVGGEPDLHVVSGTALPPPTRADLVTIDRPYIIGPFDKLTIDVFGIEELSDRKVTVDAGGNISFPLAGVTQVSGLAPGEVERALRQKLIANYVRNPQVTVNLEEAVSQVVAVEGQVKKPGLFPVIGRLTLLRAVALAGGTDEFAKLNQVVIFRTVNGQKLAALYDLNAVRKGAYEDPEVFANDVVVIDESRARRIFKDVLQVVPLFTTPIIVALDRFN